MTITRTIWSDASHSPGRVEWYHWDCCRRDRWDGSKRRMHCDHDVVARWHRAYQHYNEFSWSEASLKAFSVLLSQLTHLMRPFFNIKTTSLTALAAPHKLTQNHPLPLSPQHQCQEHVQRRQGTAQIGRYSTSETVVGKIPDTISRHLVYGVIAGLPYKAVLKNDKTPNLTFTMAYHNATYCIVFCITAEALTITWTTWSSFAHSPGCQEWCR